jgi:2-dehydropantoate 2-reductase
MKVAVLGAGAMGCLYGGSLAKIGHEVTFIDVDKRQIDCLNANGLRVETDAGAFSVRVSAGTASEISGRFDLLILFTKTIHSEEALASARHLILPETLLLSMQNGLGNRELMMRFAPENRIIMGMTGYPADPAGPGAVISRGSSFTVIMNADGKLTDRVVKIAEEITSAGLNCEATPKVHGYIWEKASFNAAVNAICSIVRLPVGAMGERGGRELAYAAARETVETARAVDVDASWERVREMLDHAFREHCHHRPSMLNDVLANRRTEAAFINGEVAKIASKAGRRAVVNETLYRLIDIIQNSYDVRL